MPYNASGTKSIPANSYAYYTVWSWSGSWIGKYSGWTAEGYVPNSGVTVSNPIINLSSTYISVQFLVRNSTSSAQTLYWKVHATTPPAYFNIIPLGADDDYARFKLSIEEHLGFCPVDWPQTFSINVYSKRKPYNVKVTNTKLTEFNAEFIAKCDFSTPSVTITCKGQAPTPRSYRVDLWGYKLVPRYYFLKLFGRERVSELSSSIYSQKTLTPDEIQETGGKKTLTVNNHLIQSQAEADFVAQNLLNCYSQIINSFIIEVSCPPPLEVGDIVSVVSQP